MPLSTGPRRSSARGSRDWADVDEATLLFVLGLGLIGLCWWRLEVGSDRERELLLWLVAAAVPLAALTAWQGIFDHGGLEAGQRLLVHGGAGGVGHMAVQLAKARGAWVAATAAGEDLDFVRSIGADQVIDYTREDYADGRLRHDVILDNVMNRSPWATARALAPGGVLIPNSIGNSGGLLAGLPRIAAAAVMGLGRTTVWTVRLDVNRENLAALAELLASGAVRTVIDRTYPLEHADQAVAHMFGHHARGKVAITV